MGTNSMNPNGVSTALMPLMPLMPNANTAIATMNNLAGMVAPMLASGDYMNMFNMMMEKWDENRQIKNRPKYDMKAQKEIAEIQVFFRTHFYSSFSIKFNYF